MRSFKTAIIALIVLVVAVAGYFSANYFIQKNNEANATPAPTPSENYIYKFNENDVVKIETKGAESFVLELTANKNWICTAPSQVNASSAAVANIVTLLTNATGEVLYDEGEYKGNLKAFGLDDPWLFTKQAIISPYNIAQVFGNIKYKIWFFYF